MLTGELAAAVGYPPDRPELAPLIPDPEAAGYAALAERGHYPINHLVVVRDELLAEHPDLAADLFEAFAESKRRYVDQLDALPEPTAVDRMHRRVRDITGGDPLPYGLEPNRAALEELARAAVDQHILDRAPDLDAMFAPGTRGPGRLMRIAIGADHNGIAIKARLIERLSAAGHQLDDRGAHGADDRGLPAAVRGRLPAGHRGPGRPRHRRRRQRRRRAGGLQQDARHPGRAGRRPVHHRDQPGQQRLERARARGEGDRARSGPTSWSTSGCAPRSAAACTSGAST